MNSEAPPVSSEPTACPRPPARAASGWTRWLALAGIFLLKFKSVLLLGGKFLGTGLSMLLSIAVYAQLFGWPYAVGFVLLIFLHELGHLAVLSRYGLRASMPVFIPFVGAMIAMREMPRNVRMEALVGFGGPLAGALSATACLVYGLMKGQELFIALAYTGFLLNLFNLIPVSPLDGGRVVAAVSRWIWLPGLLVLAVMIWFSWHPLLILIWILGAVQAYQGFFRRDESCPPGYDEVPLWLRWLLGGAYLALVGYLAVLGMGTHALLSYGQA